MWLSIFLRKSIIDHVSCYHSLERECYIPQAVVYTAIHADGRVPMNLPPMILVHVDLPCYYRFYGPRPNLSNADINYLIHHVMLQRSELNTFHTHISELINAKCLSPYWKTIWAQVPV